MGMTNAALERLRIGLFHMVKLEERHAGTPRRITASMIVPDIMATCGVSSPVAYGYLRSGRHAGYIEDDTDITSGPNRSSVPIHITDKGRQLLGNWQATAIDTGRGLREQDQASTAPAPAGTAG